MLESVSIITQNAKMHDIIANLRKVAESDYPVILIGETGTGKEIFADYIHLNSRRCKKAIVKISLTALPIDLMASELFGYEKGAFTNAVNTKKGLFEVAKYGSLFLDDIDDVPVSIQAKLLRTLESGEIMRVGGLKAINTDVRIISSTKKDLRYLIKKKQFRPDLYYRLNVVPVKIPPLRERKGDIPLLINHFLNIFKPYNPPEFSDEILDVLAEYNWPGNIRELRNVVQRLSLLAEKKVRFEDLPKEITAENIIDVCKKKCSCCFYKSGVTYKDIIHCIESKIFIQALSKAKNNQSKAAELLGLSLSTFRDKLKKTQEKSALNIK
jgi:DNA-binding NtrC family response regulator